MFMEKASNLTKNEIQGADLWRFTGFIKTGQTYDDEAVTDR